MNKKGFTLIELLIVVAVIGILASVVLVGLGPMQKQGRDARRISDLRQVQNGLELYFTKNSSYPQVNDWNSLASQLEGVNIYNIPKDPLNKSPYVYKYYYDNNGLRYCLGAMLEDKDNPSWKSSTNKGACQNPGFTCHNGSGNPNNNEYYCITL